MRSMKAHLAMEDLATWQDEHLAVADLATWRDQSPPRAYQIRYAYHLSTGCERCWSALGSMRPMEPRRLDDPFLRTLARIRLHPKVDLSLPSQALRPFIHACFAPSSVATLLLQESVALGTDFGLVSALAELLIDTPGMETEGVDLKVKTECAAVDRFLQGGEPDRAARVLESAKQHVGSCYPSTRFDVALAEFKVASCLGADAAIERMEDVTHLFPLILNDPVRRFEVRCDLLLGIYGGIGENPTIATWAVSELDQGPQGHEIQRLSGLFHKARFVLQAARILPRLLPAVAEDLEWSLGSVRLYGDLYSLAVWYQLLGDLRGDESRLEDALRMYANLELAIPFQETWTAHETLLIGDWTRRDPFRSKTTNLAYSVFGKDTAQRMAREVSKNLAACRQGEKRDTMLEHLSPLTELGVQVG